MKSFRQLCSAIVLTLVLAMSAMAGDTQTPPGCAPGETNSPPCAVPPGQTETPPFLASQGETQGPSLSAPEAMEPSMLDILLFAIQQSALVG